MFQSFVLGPVGTGRFGLIRRCVECRARAPARAATCSGFGSGCLVGRPREEARASEARPRPRPD